MIPAKRSDPSVSPVPADTPSRRELEARLAEAEELVSALVSALLAGQVDAIVGPDTATLLNRASEGADGAQMAGVEPRLRELRGLIAVAKCLRAATNIQTTLQDVVQLVANAYPVAPHTRCVLCLDDEQYTSAAPDMIGMSPADPVPGNLPAAVPDTSQEPVETAGTLALSRLVINGEDRGSIKLLVAPQQAEDSATPHRAQHYLDKLAEAVSETLRRLLAEQALRSRTQDLERTLVRLAKSEESLRQLAGWATGLQKAARHLAGCRTVKETVRIGALTPVEHLGMPVSWVHVLARDGQKEYFEVRSEHEDAIDPTSCPQGRLVAESRTSVVTIRPYETGDSAEPCGLCRSQAMQLDSCGTFPILAGKECLATLNVFSLAAPDGSSPIAQGRALLETFCGLLSVCWQRCAALEQLGEALERASAMNLAKTAFLANMSHDIRTPMNVILGFTELMQRRSGLDPELHEQLETIGRAGHHLLALINNVLEISRIESGRAELSLDAFDIHELLDDMARMFRISAEEKGVDLVLRCADAVPRIIRSDEARLRHVLINLLGNAVKYTGRGQICLQADVVSEMPSEPRETKQTRKATGRRRRLVGTRKRPLPAAFLQIEISDTGIGIAASETQRIFEPFFQSQRSKLAFGGTGLGLAIALENLELMGGDLWLSSAIAMGSTFTCFIPLEAVTEDKPVVQQQQRRILGLRPDRPPPRILVVDDDGPNRRLLSRLLEDVGFVVLQAADGSQAVAVVSSAHPDLVLMDLNMPLMNGMEATRRIRRLASGRDIKIIAVSARAFDEAQRRALEAGVDDYIRKPFRADAVLEAVGRQLGISYVYAEPGPGMGSRSARSAQAPAAFGRTASMPEAELRQRLGRLPAVLVEKLREAAIQADIDRLSSLIATAADHDQAAADHLGRLAHGFAHDRIESLLTAAPSPEGTAGEPSIT